jgi:pimeloyl-ACP methyl ester carboxylesterase
MRRRRLCAVVVPLILVACAATREQPLIDRAEWVVHRDLFPHSQDAKKRVELFWTRPAGDGPYPVLLLIHGHQERLRNGGEAFVRTGRLGVIATRGYVAAALSQPGYGDSDGPPDYCGPFTQDATMVAVDFLRRQPFVDSKRMALYGYSRGAIVASMVATRDPQLAAVVLGAERTTSSAGIRPHYRASTPIFGSRPGPRLRHSGLVRRSIMSTRSGRPSLCCTGRRMSAFRFGRLNCFPRSSRPAVAPSP